MERFVNLGVNLYGIDRTLPDSEIAEQTIEHTYRFFESIGLPMHLREVGIDESRLREMAVHAKEKDLSAGEQYVDLTADDITAILTASL